MNNQLLYWTMSAPGQAVEIGIFNGNRMTMSVDMANELVKDVIRQIQLSCGQKYDCRALEAALCSDVSIDGEHPKILYQ